MSSVSPISSNNLYPQTQQQGSIRQDFQALQQALNSGNLAASQTAFATFQKDVQNMGQVQTGQQASQASLQNDLTALGQALQSGDLAGAQKAFATFQQDAQNSVQGHHHHHHHHSQSPQQAPSSADDTVNDLSDLTGTGTNVSVTA